MYIYCNSIKQPNKVKKKKQNICLDDIQIYISIVN